MKVSSRAANTAVLQNKTIPCGIVLWAPSKVAFTLDESTVRRLQDASARLAKPWSEIVREAIFEFYDRIGRLSERERVGMLRTFDELVPKIPSRSAAEVDHELSAIRKARKMGGRRTAGLDN